MATPEDLGSAASRGVGITLGAQGLKVVLQLVNIVVLSRLLSPADFGLVAIVLAVVGIAEIFRDFGLSTAAIQSKLLSDGERVNLFWANTLLGLACATVAAAAAPVVAIIFGDPQLLAVCLWIAPVFLINGAATQLTANLTRSLSFKKIAVVMISSQVIGISTAIVVAIMGGAYWALVGQQLTIATATLVGSLIANKWIPGLPQRGHPIGRFVRFGLATVSSKSMSFIAKNVDVIALGLVGTPRTVGFYARAQEVVSAPLDQINTPLTRVALPILARIRDDTTRFQSYCEKAQLIACYVTAIGLAFIAGTAAPFIELLLGAQWLPMATILSILATAGIFRSLAQVTYWIYLARGLVKEQVQLYAFTQGIIVIFIVAGIPWGAVGIATGCAVGYLAFWLAGLWHVSRVSPVNTGPLLRRSVLVIFSIGLPIAAGSRAISNAVEFPPISLLAAGAFAVAWYSLTVAAVPTIRRDLKMMLRIAKRMRRRAE